jgi:hypothetical protein
MSTGVLVNFLEDKMTDPFPRQQREDANVRATLAHIADGMVWIDDLQNCLLEIRPYTATVGGKVMDVGEDFEGGGIDLAT